MHHKILVVDDEIQVLSAMKTFLEMKGYITHTCSAPKEALERIQRERFNIALLDISMPDMDGITLLRKIKAIRPSLEVIMMTAHSTLCKAAACWDAGASDYIIKPFSSPEEILKVVELTSQRIRRWEEAGRKSIQSELEDALPAPSTGNGSESIWRPRSLDDVF